MWPLTYKCFCSDTIAEAFLLSKESSSNQFLKEPLFSQCDKHFNSEEPFVKMDVKGSSRNHQLQ